MQPALLIRLRPAGPWRFGPGEGGQHRADTIYRSDRLYSAVSLAMQQLGWLEEWLEATARAARPEITFGSLFPYQGDTLFAPPPAALWPPAAHLLRASSPVFLAKIRWSAACFVPLTLIESLANGQTLLADRWLPDPESRCLLRRDRPSSSPFREVTRSSAAVDRITRGTVHVETSVCVEFESGSGIWTVARFASESARAAWHDRVRAAFRLLADSGFGGRRTSGWGKSAAPEFQEGLWPGLLMPKLRTGNGRSEANGNGETALYWLLSTYSPASEDAIDWAAGDYRLITRGGRVESSAGSGAEKKVVQMVSEGSVLAAHAEPVGAAVDVAPDGFAHPVYRSGLALALKLPAAEINGGPVETPGEEEAIEPRPCEPVTEPERAAVSEEISEPASPDTEATPETAPEAEAPGDEV